MSSPQLPPQPTCTEHTWLGPIYCGTGTAIGSTGRNIGNLLAAIAGSLIAFGVQVFIFLLLRHRLSRIYRPRSYLVPERERVAAPPRGSFQWLAPLFNTSNLDFIEKCGLDAYFFLRFLRTMLKFFIPVAFIVMPILLPINRYSGDSDIDGKLQLNGLDKLSIANVGTQHTRSRLWAHLVLAILIVIWFCYLMYTEMQGYVRIRQAYLTSPQHRLRASATTVLVSEIPRKWLTLDALHGLYNVLPGGIKNIWINRNFDALAGKIRRRKAIVEQLEQAETHLIMKCRREQAKSSKKRARSAGEKKKSKAAVKVQRDQDNLIAEKMAQSNGVSAGDQHDTAHNLQDVIAEVDEQDARLQELRKCRPNHTVAFDQTPSTVSDCVDTLGRGIGHWSRRVVADVDKNIARAGHGLSKAAEAAYSGPGFVDDNALYTAPILEQSDGDVPTMSAATCSDRPDNYSSSYSPRLNRVISSTSDSSFLHTSKATPISTSCGPIENHAGQGRSPAAECPSSVITRMSSSTANGARENLQALWALWRNRDDSFVPPSPKPHVAENEDAFPLIPRESSISRIKEFREAFRNFWRRLPFLGRFPRSVPFHENDAFYSKAYCDEDDNEQDLDARWRRYISPKDRQTMRLPLSKRFWCLTLPCLGKKVDKIYWLRRELARLNLEIDMDQQNIEQYPLMNSAFIQFNHQVAAHMACQSINHHMPQLMSPRNVEMSPDDILWDNMSIKWWERYMRTAFIIIIGAALVVFYAIPVTFTSLLSRVDTLAQFYPWLKWMRDLPTAAISVIQGLLPPLLLTLILLLVPMIFRLLIKQQGVATGTACERGVQVWFFAFLFVQVFFVVTLTSGLAQFLTAIAKDPTSVVTTLAQTLPSASNYFFSYLMVQALSNSASALLQIFSLLDWFVFAALFDVTPRAKWRRQTGLSNIQWGSFFPPFANFAAIGIIYSAIAPLILVFMLFIFSLFWIVYRYNVLYVYQFKHDTGGLLFPTALNQLFLGVYFMELCLTGFFFISKDQTGKLSCIPQGALMTVTFALTILYHWQLNRTFQPLFEYLPIILEDEALVRDREFARILESRFSVPANDSAKSGTNEAEDVSRNDRSTNYGKEHERRRTSHRSFAANGNARRHSYSVADSPTWRTQSVRLATPQADENLHRIASGKHVELLHAPLSTTDSQREIEAQRTVGDVLFSGFADDLEDLHPNERDVLVRYAFRHSALRAKRPVVWIPRDRLGVSDDEIRVAQRVSTVTTTDENGTEVNRTWIWMSNEGTALDAKGRVVFRRSPPDFSNVDLIRL